jgi:hypothetical protein
VPERCFSRGTGGKTRRTGLLPPLPLPSANGLEDMRERRGSYPSIPWAAMQEHMQAGRDPQHELSETDRGDDMQQRVRYQNAYAAMLALRLLDPGADLAAIYCEHHEDVLLVRQDATCWGVQVKTREPALGASRASDHEIAAALTRFVKLGRQLRVLGRPSQWSQPSSRAGGRKALGRTAARGGAS